jgi:hypothetical protein
MIDTKNYKNYLRKGDIVKILNDYFVVVSTSNKNNRLFVATLDAFVTVETSQTYSYSPTNSGWENNNDKIQKVGHICLEDNVL